MLQNYSLISHSHKLIEVEASSVQAKCRKNTTAFIAAAAAAGSKRLYKMKEVKLSKTKHHGVGRCHLQCIEVAVKRQ